MATFLARNNIQSNKIFTGLRAPLLRPVPRVYMKPPMPMDTNLHVYGHEANSVTMPRLKGRLQGDVLGPRKVSEAISEQQIFKKNFLGE